MLPGQIVQRECSISTGNSAAVVAGGRHNLGGGHRFWPVRLKETPLQLQKIRLCYLTREFNVQLESRGRVLGGNRDDFMDEKAQELQCQDVGFPLSVSSSFGHGLEKGTRRKGTSSKKKKKQTTSL